MPLEGLRWSRDSGFALYDTPQTAVLGRAGGASLQVQKLKKLSLTEELRQMQHLTRFCISN